MCPIKTSNLKTSNLKPTNRGVRAGRAGHPSIVSRFCPTSLRTRCPARGSAILHSSSSKTGVLGRVHQDCVGRLPHLTTCLTIGGLICVGFQSNYILPPLRPSRGECRFPKSRAYASSPMTSPSLTELDPNCVFFWVSAACSFGADDAWSPQQSVPCTQDSEAVISFPVWPSGRFYFAG